MTHCASSLAQQEEFQGFEPLDASFVLCPNQFLDYCVMTQKRGVVRLTGYILHQTLKWLDDDGEPIARDIPVTFEDVVAHAGVSRGDARTSIDACLVHHFIECVKTAQRKSKGFSGRVGEYRLCWNDRFTQPLDEFKGFYAGEGRRTPVPHAFFTAVLPHETLAVVRVVAAVIRNTAGYTANHFGGRRKQAALSYSFLQEHTGLSRKTLAIAIRAAVEKGYLIKVEQGVFDADQEKQTPTMYGLKWLHDAKNHSIGSERLPENTQASVQKSNQGNDQFKKVTSFGSERLPRGQFKKVTSNKERQKELPKQQHAAADSQRSFKVLMDIGFDEKAAHQISTTYPADEIERQIKWFPMRNVRSNALGLLRASIEDGWSQPKASVQIRKQHHTPAANNATHAEISAAKKEQVRQQHELLDLWRQLGKEQQRQIVQQALDKTTNVIQRRQLLSCELDDPPSQILAVMAREKRLPVGESA